MSSASEFWLVSVPGTENAWDDLYRTTNSECSNYRFAIPQLKVGTLNNLMLMSDELGKADSFIDGVTRKIARQHSELVADSGRAAESQLGATLGDLKVNLHAYMTRFEWDELKYPVKNSIKDLVDALKKCVVSIEEEMKAKFIEFNNIRSTLNQLERKSQGNLTVRSLTEYLAGKSNLCIDTEYLISVIVVVPNVRKDDFFASYERITEYVVPGSHQKLAEDGETTAFTVCCFKKVAEDFRRGCREKKWTVREWERETSAENVTDKTALEQQVRQNQETLARWCSVNFSECFMAWVHLKAIRVFVESVLRFGLPAKFMTSLLLPGKSNTKRLRTSLGQLYSNLAGEGAFGADEPDSVASAGLGVGGDFYPYVYFSVDIGFD